MITCPPKTKPTSRQRALAAANARAVLALSATPNFTVATGAAHMPAKWFVEARWDVGYSASGMYHYTKESAELELEYINCKGLAEKAALMVRLLTLQGHTIDA